MNNLNITFNDTHPSSFDIYCNQMREGVITCYFFGLVFFLLGFPACIAVLCSLLERLKTRTAPFTPNDVFILNLTVMDTLFMAFIPPKVLNNLFWHNFSFELYSSFLHALNVSGRPLLMACICLDCYLAVVHPIMYRSHNGLSPRILITCGVWVATLGFGAVILTSEQLFKSPAFFWSLYIVLPVVVYCDCCILWALRGSRASGGRVHPQKKKALQIITCSLLITVTNYLPPLVTSFFNNFFSTQVYFCLVAIPLAIPSTLTSAVMPILYLRNMGKLCHIKPKCCRRC